MPGSGPRRLASSPASAGGPSRFASVRSGTGILALLVVVGAMVGVSLLSRIGIGALSIWLDESVSVYSSRTAWWPPIDALQTESVRYMSFYYLLLSAWTHLGNSEVILRSLSVVFAALSIPVAYAFAARFFGQRAAAIAAVLLSVNSLLIEYAREARGYTLLVFLVCGSMLMFALAVERRSTAVWLGWAVATALGAYVHWFVVFVVAAQMIVLPLAPREGWRVRDLLLAIVVVGVIVAPLALVVLTSGAPGVDWISAPTLGDVPEMFVAVAGGSALVAATYLAASVVGVVRAPKRASRFGRWSMALVVAWLLVPLAGSFLASAVVPMFIDRYLILVTPAVAILAALGIASFDRVWITVVLGGALLCGSGAAALENTRAVRHEDWRSTVAYVLDQTQPGDGIIFYSGSTRQPFEYYVERSGKNPPLPIYPPGPWRVDQPLAGAYGETPAEALQRFGADGRVWLILSHAPDSATRRQLIAALDSTRVQASQEVFDLWVFARLYVPK